MNQDKEVEGFTFIDVFPEGPDCGREWELFSYFEGRLAPAEEESFAKHLASCNVCAGKLAAFDAEDQAIRNTTLDPGSTSASFENARQRVKASINAKYPPVQRSRFPFLNVSRMPAYASALTMLLLALLIYPAYRSFVLQGELERVKGELIAEKSRNPVLAEKEQRKEESRKLAEPLLSGSAVYSARPEREGEQELIEVDFGRNESYSLVFALPSEEVSRYVVEILQGDNSIWQRETTTGGPNPLISVQLQSQHLAAGDYNLRISTGNGNPLLIADYMLQIKNSKQ